jgi:transglutaminase-like putative cysteine protease
MEIKLSIRSGKCKLKGFFRGIFGLTVLIFLLGCQSLTTSNSSLVSQDTLPGQRQYMVHQQITLVNEGPGQPEKQNIWVALIRDFPPYQEVGSMEVSPRTYTLVVDEYGNHYAEFDLSNQPAGTTQTVKIDYRVTVNELTYDLSRCEGELPEDFTHPELHIESANPQIVTLARDLSQGKSTICQQVRAFYEYVSEKLVYTYNGLNWGAQAALGPMGADCTEYASLLAALSRAKGIPARYFEGLLYLDQGTNSLAKTEHAWPDVYLPNTGWVAMDPTLGRTLVNRNTYFAHYTPDHIIVTMGANPSVLRGNSYWTHLYWPGNATSIQVTGNWQVELAGKAGSN